MKRRLKYLGHVLQKNDFTRHILQLITSGKSEPKRTDATNLVETYQKDLGAQTFVPGLHWPLQEDCEKTRSCAELN